jgi:predicted molibdopterin-dependent oxidoreductase YjgC
MARADFESAWKTTLPAQPGVGARTIFAGNHGSVKAIWLCRYDPIHTAFRDVASSLRQFEFIVVQHLFMTESAQYADVILPTTAFGEEKVSFTSTERRIQIAEKVVEPPTGLAPAWEQIAHVARLLGQDWKYRRSADVMDEICETVPLYGGANYENLEREYGRQWPCTKDRPLGTSYLFGENGNGRRFKFAAVRKPDSRPAAEDYPLTLVFGHSLYYWNVNVLIRHSETLRREYRALWLDYPDGFVEINSDDAERLGIRDGQKIKIAAATGYAVTTARVTPEVMASTVYIPYFMHEVERQVLGAKANGNLVSGRIEKGAA